jgi:hypothetical protein
MMKMYQNSCHWLARTNKNKNGEKKKTKVLGCKSNYLAKCQASCPGMEE